MKRTVWLWELFGFALSALGGTVLHFLYEWLGESTWIAPFTGVNESTWEHMKLLFWPMLAFALIQCIFFKDYESFWCIKLKGALIGILMIPIIFYTYNGVIGKSPDWINIAIFFVSAAIAYIYEARTLQNGSATCRHPRLAIGALFALALLFVIFTFRTPPLGIFIDPLTGAYGV